MNQAGPTRAMLLIILMFGAIGCASRPAEPKKNSWAFRAFPIGGWVQPKPTAEAIRRYREANFNIMIASNERDVVAAAAQGLPVLLWDSKVNRHPFNVAGLKSSLAIARRHDNVVGFSIWDEPSPVDFPAIAQWTAAFREADPARWSWVNLHPVKIVPEELPGVTQYAPYLERFVEQVKPEMLSYDNYGALRESNDDIFFYKNFEDTYFYYNIAVFREQGLKHNLPFWGFALSTSHWTYFTPTEADLRFQVYSLLTYGAKGLWYFTYEMLDGSYRRQPKELKDGTDLDVGLVDPQGKPTERYRQVQKINAEVQALGPTLLTLRSVSVHHLDKSKLPKTYYLEDAKEALPLKRDPLPPGSYLKSVTGGRPLVGLFKGPDETDFFMVMNKERRKMPGVTRLALGEDRHRDRLRKGHTLGQMFVTDQPISALSLIVSSYSNPGTSAVMRLRRGGPKGEVAAVWKYFNIFGNNAAIMRFPPQPAGKYYIELADPYRTVGWWSKADKGGGAYADGQRVAGVARNFIAYGVPDLAGDDLTLTFAPNVTKVEEVSRQDGTLKPLPLDNATLTLPIAQGDAHLFKITTRK